MKTNPNFILRNIAGETLLVPVGDAATYYNGLITLNTVAEFIWKHVDDCTEEEIIQLLIQNFEVDEPTARQDTYGFINALKEVGIILD